MTKQLKLSCESIKQIDSIKTNLSTYIGDAENWKQTSNLPFNIKLERALQVVFPRAIVTEIRDNSGGLGIAIILDAEFNPRYHVDNAIIVRVETNILDAHFDCCMAAVRLVERHIINLVKAAYNDSSD